MSMEKDGFSEMLFAALRISLGWVFFWAFIDKTFGLGYYFYQEQRFGTPPGESWLAGGDPTAGFLEFGTRGKWFHDFFAGLAGNPLVTVLFMLGLLGIGVALLLGVGRKIATVSGVLMMLLMWLAELPLPNNPVVDSHIVYAIALLIIGFTPNFGRKYSLAPMFSDLLEQYPFLE